MASYDLLITYYRENGVGFSSLQKTLNEMVGILVFNIAHSK
jgi:hypothetical protein